MMTYLFLLLSFFGNVAVVTEALEVTRREIVEQAHVEVEIDKNGNHRVRKEAARAGTNVQKITRSHQLPQSGKGRSLEIAEDTPGAFQIPVTAAAPVKFQIPKAAIAQNQASAAPVKFQIPQAAIAQNQASAAAAAGQAGLPPAKLDAAGNVVAPGGAPAPGVPWTVLELRTRSIPGDPNSCYLGLFDGGGVGSTSAAIGGIYMITPEWYNGDHPGGSFQPTDWCGTLRFNWTELGAGGHAQFRAQIMTDADLEFQGNLVATYVGEIVDEELGMGGLGQWTVDDLRIRTIQGDPNSCFIGLFDGMDLNSNGGIYQVDPDWYAGPPDGHPGGTFNMTAWCGTPRFGWTALGGGNHMMFSTALQQNQDLMAQGTLLATYISELSTANADIAQGGAAHSAHTTWLVGFVAACSLSSVLLKV